MEIMLNPNKKKVEQIKALLKENGGYCPCSTIHNANTKCMCKDFRESNEPGLCHCGLYLKK